MNEFSYSDTDTYSNEIAEFYSYSEFMEFQGNFAAFKDQMTLHKLSQTWQQINRAEKQNVVQILLNQLEVADREIRMSAARSILYIAQGCWIEVNSMQEQQENTYQNVLLLHELDVFAAFVQLLNLEIESTSRNDCMDLSVILSVLYIITETIRVEKERGTSYYQDVANNFTEELNTPYVDELLLMKLFEMIVRFCSGTASHFPIKKILLLLWKVSLTRLGGIETLRKLKKEYREKAFLPPTKEDTLEVIRSMKVARIPTRENRSPKWMNVFRQVPNDLLQESLKKKSSLDEQDRMVLEIDTESIESEEDLTSFNHSFDDSILNSSDPEPAERYALKILNATRLPWTPKVRQKDIEQFLNNSRSRFFGYTLSGDHDTLAGLPQPIHDSIDIMNRYKYVSLADVQIHKEEEIARNPFSTKENDIEMTPAETLYKAMLPNFPQYMIALLKVLLAALPKSNSKRSEGINVMAEILPGVLQQTQLDIDVSRHKEIIVKAVSAILLLYLKHFKINHIYQFEFMTQNLVFANCIPLILKFFNQKSNMLFLYIKIQNRISDLNQTFPIQSSLSFPTCIFQKQSNLTSENLVLDNSSADSWRNLFSCINLLRVLNKLIKWKPSRVMVVLGSVLKLQKMLIVQNAMIKFYVLKLLKMQMKYLGNRWRKSNMRTVISAIYSQVRHRLNDDWAYGNYLETLPLDFQAEERMLRMSVDRFNNRRYPEAMLQFRKSITVRSGGDGVIDATNGATENCDLTARDDGRPECDCVDFLDSLAYTNDSNSIGMNDELISEYNPGSGGWNCKIELTEYFKNNYEIWLQDEVLNRQTDWHSFLADVEAI